MATNYSGQQFVFEDQQNESGLTVLSCGNTNPARLEIHGITDAIGCNVTMHNALTDRGGVCLGRGSQSPSPAYKMYNVYLKAP